MSMNRYRKNVNLHFFWHFSSHVFAAKAVQGEITVTKRGNMLFSCFSVCSMVAAIGDYFQRLEIFGLSTVYTV